MTTFSIDFVSPANYQSLAVEISFYGQLLCQINRERNDGVLEVEFFRDYRLLEEEVSMKFPVPEFLFAFNQACDDLRAIEPEIQGDGGI